MTAIAAKEKEKIRVIAAYAVSFGIISFLLILFIFFLYLFVKTACMMTGW